MTGPVSNTDFAVFIYCILGGFTLVALVLEYILERRG